MLGKILETLPESKYIVRFRGSEPIDKLHDSSIFPIIPAHALKGLDGARYLKEYNFKFLPGSSKYMSIKDETSSRERALR